MMPRDRNLYALSLAFRQLRKVEERLARTPVTDDKLCAVYQVAAQRCRDRAEQVIALCAPLPSEPSTLQPPPFG